MRRAYSLPQASQGDPPKLCGTPQTGPGDLGTADTELIHDCYITGEEGRLNVVVIGMGYVGIPCAALLADVSAFRVTGAQRRSERSGWKIECLNSGQ